MALPAPNRPLNPSEAMLWWMDRGAPLHFTTVLDFEGPTTESALRAALDALQRRHPCLRACITGPPEALRFAPLTPPQALPLHVEALEPAELEARLRQEIDTPMPALDAPLLRTTWLRLGPERGRLLLTLHHVVGDGHGGAYLARDLARAAQGEALTPLPDRAPLWESRPPRTRGLRGWWALDRSTGRDLLRMLRFGRPRPPEIERKVPLAERRATVLPRTFDAGLTTRLTEAARAAGTTVHALMSVVLCQAMAADAGGARAVTCASPVDLRRRLDPPVGEDLGYYIGLTQSVLRADPAASPWPLARALRADILADVARGGPTAFHLLADRLFHHLRRRATTPAALIEALYALPIRATVGITNLGRLDVPGRMGAWRLDGLFFAVAPSGLADLVTTATCFEGRLHWTLVAMAPAVSPERARAIFDDAARRLEGVLQAP